MHPKLIFSWVFVSIAVIFALLLGSCQPQETALMDESILRTQAVETIMAQIVGTAVYETVIAGINNNLPASTPQPPNIANPTNIANPMQILPILRIMQIQSMLPIQQIDQSNQ